MNVFTVCTLSHKGLFEKYLEPSAKESGFCVVKKDVPQLCKDGSYYQPGWKETMQQKIEILLEISKTHRGEIYLYSDCDVLFNPDNFSPEIAKKDLGQNFIALQNDVVQACCGFMIMRGSEELENLLSLTLKYMEHEPEDQAALNAVLRDFPIKVKILKRKKYACVRHFFNKISNGVWNQKPFRLPRGMKIFHANWTKTVEDKNQLLRFVQTQLLSQSTRERERERSY